MKDNRTDKHDGSTDENYAYDMCDGISPHGAVEQISLCPFLFLSKISAVNTCRDGSMCGQEAESGDYASLGEVSDCDKTFSKLAPDRSAYSDKRHIEGDNHCNDADRDSLLNLGVDILCKIKDIEERLSALPVCRIGKEGAEAALAEAGSSCLVAFTTSTEGLDVSHVGFVVVKEGKACLLHASSRHKKVLVEPASLKDYLSGQPSVSGMRVFRFRFR